ncbi:serine/threonine-protein kinase TBK1-like isoform X2 [Mya arenaria]|uniref:serine/threonine-protein kinase TBK1-like isoform X2 n=1 Tax=Mya arenaria TaxID=6604 RepID=UPI0022E48363|nr:serine/threonine-protein kinase TBK1-like isoform X2 [Mya arenaria]
MQYPGHVDKTGPLHHTINYVYNTADCLGKGATATVLLARSRSDGHQVAVKVSLDSSPHNVRARIRETELLRSTNHRNVMRLIACETVQETGQEVMILEYCQAGSVYSLLEQPTNSFGFQEKEFLTFLRDITEGVSYLNSLKIIHRDIKPGNILKKIEGDGSSTYVLTDFGAARELQDEDETFMSIYGTEEYIHPDMFQRGVLRQAGQSEFTSSVDLWSLGVTVFHVITGSLPFQAFGGRSDSQTICLKNLLRPILAGLFEPDRQKAWTFNQYYSAVTDIINRKTLTFYHCETSSNHKIYLHKTDCLVHIQELIAELTDIPAVRQLILIGNKSAKDVVADNEQIQTYPKSVQKAQFFVFDKDITDMHKPHIPKIPPFASLVFDTSLSNDSAVAKQCAGIAYFIEFRAEEVIVCQDLALESIIHLRYYVEETLRPAVTLVPESETHLVTTKRRVEMIESSQKMTKFFMNILRETQTTKYLKDMASYCTHDVNLADVLHKTTVRQDEIKVYLDVLTNKLREHSTPGAVDHLGCNEQDHCLTKIGHLRQGIQAVSSTFSKHKKYGSLHPHEEFIHKTEREKLEDLCVRTVDLYQSHCVCNLKTVHKGSHRVTSILLKHMVRGTKVESNLKCVRDCLEQIDEKLCKVEATFKRIAELSSQMVSQNFSETPTPLVRTEIPDASSATSVASSKYGERSALVNSLASEMENLRTSRSDLDSILNLNTDSLRTLKRLLEGASRLSMNSFQHEKQTISPSSSNVDDVKS